LKNNWLIFANDDILSNKLAKKILMIAEESIKLKGDFTIVLAGGKSPKKLYEILKGSNSEWDKWIVYIGDERCLPIDDNERNDGQIMKEWLNVSHIKKENIYSIKAELGMLNAKLDYEKVLSKVDVFDVVLLSVVITLFTFCDVVVHNRHYIYSEWVCGCCLTANQQFISYIMARTNYMLMR